MIALNMTKPKSKPAELVWPSVNVFAVYDGHGGVTAAEYLWTNLHHMIVEENCFPENPKQAIRNAFNRAEENLLKGLSDERYN